MIKSKRIYISGSIHGVFFRQFTKENAEKLNVRGYMRTLEDGRVEIFVEGDSNALDKLIPILTQSSRYAQVRDYEIKDEKFQDFKEFKILKF